MNKDSQMGSYSEPIQEIIGMVPSWITRFGISVMLALFLSILALGYVIRLPRIVSVPIVIRSEMDLESNTSFVTGMMEIPPQSISVIKEGQHVSIKLLPFSYLEFGTITGIVTDAHLVSGRIDNNELRYYVSVSFPEGLQTSNGYNPPSLPEIEGTAEIITEYVRLINYLVEPASFLVHNK